MTKNISTNIKVVLIIVVVLAVAVAVYFAQSNKSNPNQVSNEATSTVQKPLTIAEQKDLLKELAKPVSSDVKPITQNEQVKLLEQLAKPVEDKAITASGTVVDTPKAKAFTVDEQMKLLEQLKAR